jgi:hypothetical protein
MKNRRSAVACPACKATCKTAGLKWLKSGVRRYYYCSACAVGWRCLNDGPLVRVAYKASIKSMERKDYIKGAKVYIDGKFIGVAK